MKNQSQSVSVQLIVSLAAVVAVNSAVWWHRSKVPKLESEETATPADQDASLRDNKTADNGRNAKKSNKQGTSSTIKGRKLGRPDLMKKDSSIKSPKKYVASPKKGVLQSKRHTIPQINVAPIQNRSRKTQTKKLKPRVRESLLPWKSARQDCNVGDTKSIASRQNDQSEKRKPTKVRTSLLPQSLRDENIDPPSETTRKPVRKIPRVRDSLLPESIQPKHLTATNFGDEDSVCSARTSRSRYHIHEPQQKQKQESQKPSADGPSLQNCVTVRKTTRREERHPRLVHLNDSNVSTRSPVTSSLAEKGNKTAIQSPLRNVSNTKRSRVPSKRRKSRELKEEGWKSSTVSKLPKETMKSPTLLKLSSRRSDVSDCDVQSLCKVFEH
ncbi:unnamed protein product [Cylindrotheca closterium]|uniref:Uncharacterized protein n=1 Tax=Cylindrotheca closterium TaxID=2856 RepID=A0AAD2FF68_9STRA|nr:unnamed protein product [Cylindrotheca closterium]